MSSHTQHLRWARLKLEGKEHVSLRNFVRQFKFTDKDSANTAFLSLIHSPEIRKSRRIKIYRAFVHFQKNEEDLFWTQRAIQVNTAVTTNQITVAAQKAGSKKGALEYDRQYLYSETLFAENELIDDSNDSDSDTEAKSASTDPSNSVGEPFGVDDNDAVEDVEQIMLTPMKATPFYSLIQYAFNKVQGKNVDLPPVPECFSSPVFRELFLYAWKEFDKARKLAASNRLLKKQKEFSVDKDVLGELASPATKHARTLLEDEFGLTTRYIRGRKVDISARIYLNFSWDQEIGIYELKSSTISEDICERQQRKAVRLNGAVLMDLERKGVDISKYFPVIAEGKGLTIHLYTLRRYGDILGAGHATNCPIWLPADLIQLKQFLLSDSLHVLIAFAEHTKMFALDVKNVLAGIPSPCLPSTPPQKHAEVKPYILLSPSKNNKHGRIDDDDVFDY
ncbi:hypothetical protein FBU30_001732 [Linnemannia zychae]|nr:hypothetical protein FBU30_001732 [Linnemannia zychae]